eukprot:snap_masked-scaffold_11-processed-gene-8.30-mRNA-1 protein AED:1.00 eAED:1.00 QI:0/-1/0/0/-1/1/1/0/434
MLKALPTSLAWRKCNQQHLKFSNCSKRFLKLYGYGQQISGALATGAKAQNIPFSSPIEIPFFRNKEILSIACGWGHTALLTKESVYVVGRTHDIKNLIRFSQIASGSPFLARLSVTFKSDLSVEYPELTEVKLDGIKNIFAGAATSCFLTNEGEAYMMGNNRYGQCAVPMSSTYLNPEVHLWDVTKIPGLNGVKKVEFGFQHTLMLDEEGNLFVCGKGENGQLGNEIDIDSKVLASDKPEIILNGVKDIAAGLNSSCVLKEDGTVLVFGKYQSLDIDETKNLFLDEFRPRKVKFFDVNGIEVESIYGGNYGFAASDGRNVFLWGLMPDWVDVDTTVSRIKGLKRDDFEFVYQIEGKSVLYLDRIKRFVKEPVRVTILEEHEKLINGYDSLWKLNENTGNLIKIDWSLSSKEYHFPNFKPVDLFCGWKHGFILAE